MFWKYLSGFDPGDGRYAERPFPGLEQAAEKLAIGQGRGA
jgi:hypothetical protein